MNVEVLGSDICYGNSPNTILRKQQRDVFLGGGLTDFLSDVTKGISKAFTSDTGKALTSAVLETTAKRITPTQKAQIASMQEAAGINPQALTSGGSTFINWPTGKTDMTTMIPLAIGGVALLALMAMMFKISR